MVRARMSIVSIFILVFALGDLFWWRRAHRTLRSTPGRSAVAIFAIAQLGESGCSSRVAGRAANGIGSFRSRGCRSSIFGIFAETVALAPRLSGAGLGRGCWAARRRGSGWPGQPRTRACPAGNFFRPPARRRPQFSAIGGVAGALPQLDDFRVRRLDVPVNGLPLVLEGLTIAHVSDIHVGRFTQGRVLERIVAETNALAADMILCTGDLINFALRDLPVALDVMKGLRAPHGVHVCEGNHDLIEDGPAFERRTRDAGVNLLVNETVTLAVRGTPVQILGQRWGGPPGTANRASAYGDPAIAASARQLLTSRDPDAFPILLAHHPHAFDYAADIPLTLAGHTHGGQVMFTKNVGFGPWLFRYWSGWYRRHGRTLVVSNGAGNWFPLRINARAEIALLTLRAFSETPRA